MLGDRTEGGRPGGEVAVGHGPTVPAAPDGTAAPRKAPGGRCAAASVRDVCLLVVAWQCEADWPLVMGANRDEWLDRPTTAMTVLQDGRPRIIGGRDERAGGTWLAVNGHGVVCGLTNRPMPDGPDPTKRSRGHLPLLAAACATADEAAVVLAAEADANAYNPAWILVGDRRSLHYVEVGPEPSNRPRRLEPGVHILENAALGVASLKVDHVRAMLDDHVGRGASLWEALPVVLGDHSAPETPPGGHRFADGRQRLEATLAACVHADGYGTRSSTMVRVGEGPGDRPDVLVADGRPCVSPFVDAGALWAVDPEPARDPGGGDR